MEWCEKLGRQPQDPGLSLSIDLCRVACNTNNNNVAHSRSRALSWALERAEERMNHYYSTLRTQDLSWEDLQVRADRLRYQKHTGEHRDGVGEEIFLAKASKKIPFSHSQ